MLVLSRKKNEGITIAHPAGNVHVVVVEIRGDKVRLGIEADRSITVHRDEVQSLVEAELVAGRLPSLRDQLDQEENQSHGE